MVGVRIKFFKEYNTLFLDSKFFLLKTSISPNKIKKTYCIDAEQT
jgi:hypothetical protein